MATPLHHRLGRGTAVVALVAASLLPARPFAQPATGDEETVIVWRRVRNDFHAPDIPQSFVQELVAKTPASPVLVKPGETISSKLQQSFNISASWTPSIYRAMVERVVELNGLAGPNSVPAGTQLQMPSVPVTGKRFHGTLPGYTGQNVRLALPGLERAPAAAAGPSSVRAPQTEIQYFSVPRSRVKEVLLDGAAEQGASGTLTVTFGQAGNPSGTARLSKPAAELIKSSLDKAGADRPRPVLVIVDDVVPDHIEYARTVQFVKALSKAIREHYELGESPYGKDLEALGSTIPAADASTLYPNLRRHAAMIKHSLSEFVELDQAGKVQVVYLPLRASQLAVTPLFKEILYLAELLKLVNPPPVPVESADITQREGAQALVETAIALNKGVYSFAPLLGDSTMNTDRALLEAYAVVLGYFSDVTGRPHAFSFSWTVPKLDVSANFVQAYGIKFAAAGNHPDSVASQNFITMELQFAARAALQRDFVAVLNSGGAAAGCRSNIFDDASLEVSSVAYPGAVTPSICGTSFSTPRIAWLMAAREASFGTRPPVPLTPGDKLSWVQRQGLLIARLKSTSKPDLLQRHSIDPLQLFQP